MTFRSALWPILSSVLFCLCLVLAEGMHTAIARAERAEARQVGRFANCPMSLQDLEHS